MEKILSIVIPTYNAEKFLDKGLTSFIMKDEKLLSELEVIVVNDGTPDKSVEVAQKYVDMHPDVFRIVNKKNGGHGSAINEGVKHVTGKYFKVIDADDWVDTEALERTMKILETEEFDAMIQSFRTYDISQEPAKIEPWDIKYPESLLRENKIYTLKELMDNWWDVQCSMTFHGVLYNTEFYKKQNYELIEHVYYEDQEYATIPLCWAEKIRLYDDELYVYRIGDVNQSISVANLYKRLPDFEAVMFRMMEFDKVVDKCPAGGYEYWMKKVAKFVGDTYQLTLVRCEDKKKYRKFCKELTNKIKAESPRMYGGIKNKYRAFKILNAMHMSEETYQTKFMDFLAWTRKHLGVEKLHG